MATKQPGRPRLPRARRRHIALKIFLTDAEYQALLAASDGGFPAVTARELMLRGLRKEMKR